MLSAGEITAVATSASIFTIFCLVSSLYLLSNSGRDSDSQGGKHIFSWKFHVETFRFYGLINFVIILVIGAIITEKSNFDTIPDPTETRLFRLFGFNHSCNFIDHNPAKLIAALLIPSFQIPMMLYTVFYHLRLERKSRDGEIPKWLLNTSRIVSPYNMITYMWLHMWFVNNPETDYGFLAHYIPYLMLQISFAFGHILNINYLICVENLPWGISPKLAWSYFGLFLSLTIFSVVFVITTLAGNQILDTLDNEAGATIITAISGLWVFLAFIGNVILAAKERKDGDSITLAMVSDRVEEEEDTAGVEELGKTNLSSQIVNNEELRVELEQTNEELEVKSSLIQRLREDLRKKESEFSKNLKQV